MALDNNWSPAAAMCRLERDIIAFKAERLTSIDLFVAQDMWTVHALICGPADTPYHNGLFYFVLRFSEDYPYEPPLVEMKTTDGGTLTFHPFLDNAGNVVISILSRDTWSPAQTLLTLLLSIQSVFSEIPFANSADHSMKNPNDILVEYNRSMTYETLRVAVIGMIEGNADVWAMPFELWTEMCRKFVSNFGFYVDLIQSNIKRSGDATSPFNDLLTRLLDQKCLFEFTYLNHRIGYWGTKSEASASVWSSLSLDSWPDEEQSSDLTDIGLQKNSLSIPEVDNDSDELSPEDDKCTPYLPSDD